MSSEDLNQKQILDISSFKFHSNDKEKDQHKIKNLEGSFYFSNNCQYEGLASFSVKPDLFIVW